MKELFDEIEEAGEFIDMGYAQSLFFLTIRKDKYDEIKQKYCDPDWTGYDEKIDEEHRPDKSRKGFPYRKGRKGGGT